MPAIVQATPYDKTGAFMSDDIDLYAANGYALVVVDLRGRGKSEGLWRPIVHDGPDCHDVIEWAAVQNWCTGKVGMTGLSYMGWVQWAAASQHPPHLAAMVSTSAAGRWQQEIPYTNGCFQLYFGWWAYMVRRRILESHGPRDQQLGRDPELAATREDRRVHQPDRSGLGRDGRSGHAR